MITSARYGLFLPPLFLLLLLAHIPALGQGARLRVVTINVWSGLDDRGGMEYGEHETPARREERFDRLVEGLRRSRADVIFVQEANPAGGFASRLASRLGFDEIHQVTDAGFKIGPFGSPVNLKLGLATLSRRSLGLREHDVVKLSGPFGIYGDPLSAHAGDASFALVGCIVVADHPLFLVNTQLADAPAVDSSLRRQFLTLSARGDFSDADARQALDEAEAGRAVRMEEVARLSEYLRDLAPAAAVVGGDFNAGVDSPELKHLFDTAGYLDSYRERGPVWGQSWNVERNRNTAFAIGEVDASGESLDPYGMLRSLYDRRSRRNDAILLSPHFLPDDILEAMLLLDEDSAGAQASDHFGVLTELRLDRALASLPREPRTVIPPDDVSLVALPILSYDADVGFGYGADLGVFNMLGGAESFRLLLLRTTLDQRRYRLGLSIPDREYRWGKKYTMSVDLAVDFDRREQTSFFGTGADSRLSDRELYIRDAFELSATLGSAIYPRFVAEAGWRYRRTTNEGFSDSSRLRSLAPPTNVGDAVTASLHLAARYDTRDRLHDPTYGTVIRLEGELGPQIGITNVSFSRVSLWLQGYRRLWYPRTVLAMRLGLQSMTGDLIPTQMLLSLGGGMSLRGFSRDRFVDRVGALFNTELRFAIWSPLGGIVGFDAGRVWNQLTEIGFKRWETSGVIGLRGYFDDLVLRLDAGFGREGTAWYVGVGEVF